MPKSILGLQISSGKASAVKIKSLWKGFQVESAIQDQDIELLLSSLPQADAVATAIPSSGIFRRLVTVPFTDRPKISAAAPLEAEESLPLPLEDLVFDIHVLSRQDGKSEVLFFASPISLIAKLIAQLNEAGVAPRALDAEPLALANVLRFSLPAEKEAFAIDLSPQGCQGVHLDGKGSCSFFSFSEKSGSEALLAEAARCLSQYIQDGQEPISVFLSGPDALEQNIADWNEALGATTELMPFPAEGAITDATAKQSWPGWAIPLGLALREVYSRETYTINLLQGPFAPVHEETPRKLAMAGLGVFLCILAALWGSSAWVETSHKEMQYNQLKKSVEAAIEKSLPGVRVPPGTELAIMEKELKTLSTRAATLGSIVDRELSAIRILKELSSRISKTPEVEISKFAVKEGRAILEGSTESFDAVDKIAAEIGGYPRFQTVKVTHTEKKLGADKVLFKLSIDMKLEG